MYQWYIRGGHFEFFFLCDQARTFPDRSLSYFRSVYQILWYLGANSGSPRQFTEFSQFCLQLDFQRRNSCLYLYNFNFSMDIKYFHLSNGTYKLQTFFKFQNKPMWIETKRVQRLFTLNIISSLCFFKTIVLLYTFSFL